MPGQLTVSLSDRLVQGRLPELWISTRSPSGLFGNIAVEAHPRIPQHCDCLDQIAAEGRAPARHSMSQHMREISGAEQPLPRQASWGAQQANGFDFTNPEEDVQQVLFRARLASEKNRKVFSGALQGLSISSVGYTAERQCQQRQHEPSQSLTNLHLLSGSKALPR